MIRIKTLVLLFIASTCLFSASSALTCTQGSITPAPSAGQTITVSAPPDWEGRALDYEWDVVDATTEVSISPLYGVTNGYTDDEFTFEAPEAGSYKIMLTVEDEEYDEYCMDTQCMGFSTDSSNPCPLTPDEFCEADLPTGMAYPAQVTYTGTLTAGRALQWILDDGTAGETIIEEGLGTQAGIDVVDIDWSTVVSDVNAGETHTITLNVYKQPFTYDEDNHFTGTLLDPPCSATISFVAKPVAEITD